MLGPNLVGFSVKLAFKNKAKELVRCNRNPGTGIALLFTTLGRDVANLIRRKPAWMLGPCLRLYLAGITKFIATSAGNTGASVLFSH